MSPFHCVYFFFLHPLAAALMITNMMTPKLKLNIIHECLFEGHFRNNNQYLGLSRPPTCIVVCGLAPLLFLLLAPTWRWHRRSPTSSLSLVGGLWETAPPPNSSSHCSNRDASPSSECLCPGSGQSHGARPWGLTQVPSLLHYLNLRAVGPGPDWQKPFSWEINSKHRTAGMEHAVLPGDHPSSAQASLVGGSAADLTLNLSRRPRRQSAPLHTHSVFVFSTPDHCQSNLHIFYSQWLCYVAQFRNFTETQLKSRDCCPLVEMCLLN